MTEEKTKEQIEQEIKALQERKAKLESEAKRIAELRHEEEIKLTENKIQTAKEYLNVQPVKAQRKEIPQDWDRNINVSAENVEIKGRDGKVKIEFRVELHSYVDK